MLRHVARSWRCGTRSRFSVMNRGRHKQKKERIAWLTLAINRSYWVVPEGGGKSLAIGLFGWKPRCPPFPSVTVHPGIPTLRDRILFLCDEQRARLPEGLGPRRSRNVVSWSVGMPCPGARKVYGRTGILGPWPGESRSRGKTERFRLVNGGGGVSERVRGSPRTWSVAPPRPSGFSGFLFGRR